MIQAESYWKNRPLDDSKRDWDYNSNNWITDYYCSALHEHRKVIIEELEKLQPFKSVLEIGCNIGPNLLRIRDIFPKVKLAGVDINETAIAEGKKILKNVDLKVADIDELPFKKRSFDIVLADAVLIYVGPDKINKVISEMKRVSKKGIVLVEWHDDDSATGIVKEFHWCRNYKSLLEAFGYKVEVRRILKSEWPTKKWFTFGRVYIAVPR